LKVRGPKLGLDCRLGLVSELEAREVLGSSIHISGTVAAGDMKFLWFSPIVGMSLCALTLCCGVKIVRVIRAEIWEVFLNISGMV